MYKYTIKFKEIVKFGDAPERIVIIKATNPVAASNVFRNEYGSNKKYEILDIDIQEDVEEEIPEE